MVAVKLDPTQTRPHSNKTSNITYVYIVLYFIITWEGRASLTFYAFRKVIKIT